MTTYFYILALIQMTWLLAAFRWYLRRSDEIPIVFAVMALYSTGYRYWVVQQGYTDWVPLEFSGYAPITNSAALGGLFWVVVGQSILIGAYMWKQDKRFTVARGRISHNISEKLKNVADFWRIDLSAGDAWHKTLC
jgi:hypothetical protein